MLGECLRALEAQTYRGFIVAVVDNASTDDSLENLPQFPGLFVHRNTENPGFAVANNQVGLVAETPYIACLNPDTIPQPEWLERLVAAARSRPDYAMFGSTQLDAANPAYADGLGDEYFCTGFAWRRGNGAPAPAPIPTGEVFAPCAAAALYRTEAFKAAGGFERLFFCYMEDVDLAFRLRLRGAKCLQVGDAVVLHHGYAVTGSRSDFMLYHSTRNMVWTYHRNMPTPLLIVTMLPHLLCMAAIWLWAVRRGHRRAVSRAFRHALRGLPQMLVERRRIQSTRTASSREIARAMLWNPWKIIAWRRRVGARDRRKVGESR